MEKDRNNCKKELDYFQIEGAYGGNQRWMRDWWMHIGGCAALTACDVFLYCALHKGRPEWYPYDLNRLTKKDYRKFAMSMKLYLQPRKSGIKDLDTFMDGFHIYLEDTEATELMVSGFDGGESLEDAKRQLMRQIDSGMPAAYLMLRHQDRKFNFFEWHWFLVNGYEERTDGFYIKVATYGAAHWLCLDELWDTGYEEKGGLVFFDWKHEHDL